MESVVAAAVQAAYVLMDREATLDKTVGLVRKAAAEGARLIVLPEAFIPGTPIWIDTGPIWEGDEQWYSMLVDQAVVVPSESTDTLGAAAREAGAFLVVGVDENVSPTVPPSSTRSSTLVRTAPSSGSTAS